MRLLASTKKDVDQDKDGEDVPKLEPVEFILVHCNLVNNNYQQASKVFFNFVPNKRLGLWIAYYCSIKFIKNDEHSKLQNFHPLNYGLLIKIVSNLKQKIMLICQ